jgi:hypothetical protein
VIGLPKPLFRVASGLLVVLVGVAVGFGGFTLWRATSSSWPDLVATTSTIKGVASGMLILAVLLLVAGIAAVMNRRWGRRLAAIAILAFVVGGFCVNYILFGDIRPVHSGANAILAIAILLMLRAGAGVDA